ncbi:MAG: carboxypeptidase-like regulatory domain-containing protein [Thermoleophilia bacterium]
MSIIKKRFMPLLFISMLTMAGFMLGVGSLRGFLATENIASADPTAPTLLSALADKEYKVTRTMTISGRVTDADGRPIAGIIVDAQPASPGASSVPVPFQTDDNGNYSIEVSSPGFFKIHFLGGQVGRSSWVSLWYGNQGMENAAKAVPTGASGVNAVMSATGVLNGHIKYPPDTQPLLVHVVAYRADEQKIVGEGNANPVSFQPGDFILDTLPAGNYKLLLLPEGSTIGVTGGGINGPFWYGGARDWSGAREVQIQTGSTTDIDISFPTAPEAGSIHGLIRYELEAYDAPVLSLVEADNAEKVVAEVKLSGALYLGVFSRFAFTDVPDGGYKLRYTLPDAQPIWYQESSSGGTLDFSQATTISIGGGMKVSSSLHFDALSLPAEVSGQLSRDDGTAVSYQPVYAERLSGDRSIISNSFAAWTDVSGRFSGKLAPGTYRICAIDWASLKEYCEQPIELGSRKQQVNVDLTMPVQTAISDT